MPDRTTGPARPRGAAIAANLALGLLSLLFTLGALELGLRYLASRASQAENADSAVAVAGGDVTPIYVPSPTLGWTLRPDTLQEFRRRDFDTWVRSNALGFRAPQMRPAPPGVERWVVLGDSYGFGWGVEEDSTYAARLAALLNQSAGDTGCAPFEVVNAALPGFGTFQRWRALETLLPYGIDGVVIEFSVSNDVVDDWRAAPYVPDRLGDYQARGTQFTVLERWATAHSVLARTVWERAMPLRLWMEARRGVNLRRTSALYDSLVARARDAGLAVVILTNASRTQVLGDEGGLMGWLADSGYGRRPNRMIAEVIARNHLPAVDGEAAFRGATASELFLGRDVHWTPAGHERVAEALVPLVRESSKSRQNRQNRASDR